jgi:hypothetical protein
MAHLEVFQDKIVLNSLIDTQNNLIEQAKQTKQYIEKYLEYRNQSKNGYVVLIYQNGEFTLKTGADNTFFSLSNDQTEYVAHIKSFDKLIDLINLMKGDDDKCLKEIQKNKFNL